MGNIHSGYLPYLTRLQRTKYGKHKYWMKMLKQWSDGRMTVQFVPYEPEKN